MKKNTMMRVASALMIAVLLTTCAISGTFAKYTTKYSVDDSARVAYWGFNEPTGVTWNLFTHGDGNVIASVDGKDLIAPGTTGTATLTLAFAPNGTITKPEVAYTYQVSLTATGTYNKLDDNPNFVWKYNGNEYQKFAELAAEINSSENVAAGNLPVAPQTYTIGWEWKFNESDAANNADTEMGNATDLDNITVTLTITATQVN